MQSSRLDPHAKLSQQNHAIRKPALSRAKSTTTAIHLHSTIRFLEPRPSTLTTELLGLTSPAVGNQQCSIVLYQRLLQLVLSVLVDEFLVIGHDALCDRLADGVDLRCVAATGDAHADVDDGELVEADDEDGFVDLHRD
jgi:hypothetical protein